MDNRLQADRSAENRQSKTTTTTGSIIAALYAGVALTIVAIIVAYVDHATSNTLADHIRAGYPTYTQTRINTAATTYLVYLSIIGVLGVAAWLWTIRAVKKGKRWTRGATTAIFALGTSIALTNLLIHDTSGETGLPPLLGWVGMLPSVAGLLAVILLWRKQPEKPSG